MPSNIFATTSTNVSILFLDRANIKGDIVLMDASKLGETIKEGKNQKTILRYDEEECIINTFNEHISVDEFSVVVGYEELKKKNYSFSAGQYFDIKIEHNELSFNEYLKKINEFKVSIDTMFSESRNLEKEIQKNLSRLTYE